MATSKHFRRELLAYIANDREKLRQVTKHAVGEMLRWSGPANVISAIARQRPGVTVDIIHGIYARSDGNIGLGMYVHGSGLAKLCLRTDFEPCVRATVLAGAAVNSKS